MTEEVYRKMLRETLSDDELQQLAKTIQDGWPDEPNQVSKCLKKYYTFREELGTYNGLLFKGSRIIIPESMKKYALQLSHVGHNGVQQPVRRAKDAMCSYAS
jgi:hypothetical protein